MIHWSANLAYAIGLITTDGSLSKDGRHIDFTSKDVDLIRTFARILNLNNKVGLKTSSYGKGNQYFRIQFGNVKLYKFLLDIGLKPNKTLILGPLAIPDIFFADFLRGHLDGDGNINAHWDAVWPRSYRLYLTFMSASLNHIVWIQTTISRIYGLQGQIRYAGKSTYRLVYAKHASIKLTEHMYHKKYLPSLARKRLKIASALGIIHGQAEVVKLVYTQP